MKTIKIQNNEFQYLVSKTPNVYTLFIKNEEVGCLRMDTSFGECVVFHTINLPVDDSSYIVKYAVSKNEITFL